MKEVFNEECSSRHSDIKGSKAHEYTKRYKIFMVKMTNTVIYPSYQVGSRKYLLIHETGT